MSGGSSAPAALHFIVYISSLRKLGALKGVSSWSFSAIIRVSRAVKDHVEDGASQTIKISLANLRCNTTGKKEKLLQFLLF